MKKEFSDLTKEQSAEILRYFKAAIRDPETGMIHGDAEGVFEKGLYVTKQWVNFNYKKKKIFVVWRIVQDADGILKSIGNDSLGGNSSEFDNVLFSLLNDVLEAAYKKESSTFYKRNYFTCINGNIMHGEHWIDNFRFAPLFVPDDCHYFNAERIYVIDQGIAAVDDSNASEIAKEKALIFASYLSFLLDIGLDEHHHEVKYFLKKDGGYTMERCSTQLMDTNKPPSMPVKGQLYKHIPFQGSVFNHGLRPSGVPVVCPKETRKIFSALRDAEEKIKEAFNSCCRMYQLALILGYRRPTVRVAYMVGAIDAIVQTDKKAYLSTKSFMSKYAGVDEEFCDGLWSRYRSAHWHAGATLLGETETDYDGVYTTNSFDKFAIPMNAQHVVKSAILGWLDEKTDFSKK